MNSKPINQRCSCLVHADDIHLDSSATQFEDYLIQRRNGCDIPEMRLSQIYRQGC